MSHLESHFESYYFPLHAEKEGFIPPHQQIDVLVEHFAGQLGPLSLLTLATFQSMPIPRWPDRPGCAVVLVLNYDTPLLSLQKAFHFLTCAHAHRSSSGVVPPWRQTGLFEEWSITHRVPSSASVVGFRWVTIDFINGWKVGVNTSVPQPQEASANAELPGHELVLAAAFFPKFFAGMDGRNKPYWFLPGLLAQRPPDMVPQEYCVLHLSSGQKGQVVLALKPANLASGHTSCPCYLAH